MYFKFLVKILPNFVSQMRDIIVRVGGMPWPITGANEYYAQ